MNVTIQTDLTDFYPSIASESQPITTAKIQRIALSCLGTLTLSVSVATCSFPPICLASFVCTGLIYLFYRSIKDYENPRELRMMQIAASSLSFSDLMKEHSLDKITRYNVVSTDTLQKKFYEHYQGMPLSQIVRAYSFATIEAHQLASKATLSLLLAKEVKQMHVSSIPLPFLTSCFNHGLIRDSDLDLFKTFENLERKAKNNFEIACTKLNAEYPKRTEKLLELLDIEENQARLEANALERKIIDSGCKATRDNADTKTALDLWFTDKKTSNIVLDNWERKREGENIVCQTAKETSDAFFLKRREEIRMQKQMICSYDIGGKEQRLYEQEMDCARNDLAYQIQELQNEFQTAICTITKMD
jgi:hypothetical protein